MRLSEDEIDDCDDTPHFPHQLSTEKNSKQVSVKNSRENMSSLRWICIITRTNILFTIEYSILTKQICHKRHVQWENIFIHSTTITILIEQ